MIRVFRAVAPLCAGLFLLAGAAHALDAEGSADTASRQHVLPARLSAADKVWVARIEQELNHALTFKARIQQIDAEGKRTTGTVWMKRPRPDASGLRPAIPFAAGCQSGQGRVRDSQLDQTTVIPMDRTPLGPAAARQHVSLSDGVTVDRLHPPRGRAECRSRWCGHPHRPAMAA
jgi:hypothetical protein